MDINYMEPTEEIEKIPRADLIRLARESCVKNYCGDTMKSRKQIMEELAVKEKMALAEKMALQSKPAAEIIDQNDGGQYQVPLMPTISEGEPDNFLTSISNAEPAKSEKPTETAKEKINFRLFAVRCIISLLILIGVIAVDKLQLSYQNLNSKTVFENLTSKKTVESIEEFIVSFSQKE